MFGKLMTVAGLTAMANAHVYMAEPKPFSSQSVSNGPLDPSGSNFPCKSTGSSSDFSVNGVSNTWALGSQQTLKTEGTAVHGGGSCQLSITYDTAPTKDSTWKVIHSIEGGCPSRNTAGNLAGNSASAVNPDTYDFNVPDNIPSGDVTFAWTWLNRIGNREFYMNCAPVTLTGGGGSKSNYESLPDMVVLNTNGITDATPEGVDYQFSDPGPSPEINLNKSGWGSVICCEAGCGSDKCSASSPQPDPSPEPTEPEKPTPSNPGGVFITTEPTPDTPEEPVADEPEAPAPTPSTPVNEPTEPTTPPTTPPTGGDGGSAGSACSQEGMWNCLDGSSFQRCASGTWSPVTKMAAGTECNVGQSAQMKITAISKRGVRAFQA